MKELIINDRNLGCCTAYRQSWTAWKFAMAEGFEVSVPLYMIKRFVSGDDALELTLYEIEIKGGES